MKFHLTPIIACLFLVFVIILNQGCENKDINTIISESPTLISSPDTIKIIDTLAVGEFFITNNSVGELDWKVTSKPNWLSVDPFEGVSKQSIQKINVIADSSGLSIGTHTGKIEIISTGGKIDVVVLFTKELHPFLFVSDTTIDFADSTYNTDLYLFSTGSGYLNWSISLSQDWCALSQYQGSISPGDSIKINLTATRFGLPIGELFDTLYISSNASNGPINIPIRIDVLAEPYIVSQNNIFSFDYFQDTTSLHLYNQGNVSGTYSLEFGDTYLSSLSASGTIGTGEIDSIKLIIDRSALQSDTLPSETFVRVLLDNNRVDSIPVWIYNYNPNLWTLDFRIVDAEYCRAIDKIIAISSDPNKLHLIDPINNSIQSLDLVLPPNCVTIRFDGNYAVVGHDGLITYVDVTNWQIVKTLPVTANALDIVLPSNGWVYVFPKTDQWERIRCVEIASGLEIPHVGRSIYAGTVAKLHPSEEFIYGADNGLSPSDFEKYDIRTDTLTYLYDSPYHGDYSFSGNIWISDDGLRLFARSSNVFRASSVLADDMIYNGNLAGVTRIAWAEHSSLANYVMVLGETGSWWDPINTELYAYGDEFLAYKGKVSLPKYLLQVAEFGGVLYKAQGRFVFANNAGTELYVLAKADEASGLLYDWSIITIQVSDLP